MRMAYETRELDVNFHVILSFLELAFSRLFLWGTGVKERRVWDPGAFFLPSWTRRLPEAGVFMRETTVMPWSGVFEMVCIYDRSAFGWYLPWGGRTIAL